MKEVPIPEKAMLTIEETTALTNIGRDKIKELLNNNDCNFSLKVGTKTLIKRERFIDYITKRTVI